MGPSIHTDSMQSSHDYLSQGNIEKLEALHKKEWQSRPQVDMAQQQKEAVERRSNVFREILKAAVKEPPQRKKKQAMLQVQGQPCQVRCRSHWHGEGGGRMARLHEQFNTLHLS